MDDTRKKALASALGPIEKQFGKGSVMRLGDAEVSLETPMACGIEICFTCVAKVKDPNGDWVYKRTCVEGPVFDAAKIEW